MMNEIQYLFLLSLPRSGSTAIASVLNTSPYTMFLHPKAEGMRLIKSVWDDERWNPEKSVDWKTVQREWEKKIAGVQDLVGTISVVIEKSPSNIVRANQLNSNFTNAKFIISNRNPYAYCSGIVHRRKNPPQNPVVRKNLFIKLATEWILRSQYQINNIENQDLDILSVFSYENFCADTDKIIAEISSSISEMKTCNTSSKIQVKDFSTSTIKNMNEEQINRLSSTDIDSINAVLLKNINVLNYFGYDIINKSID